MAKTDIFDTSSSVATTEAITGIQAPIQPDFVQYPNITVENDHGVSRRQQNLVNNLKSNSGIERIPFNGIDELDTEQGPNGETVHALNTGDSRIRFVGSGWFFGNNGVGSNTEGFFVRGPNLNDYVEITFYGTHLNLLTFMSSPNTTPDWRVSSDGGTTEGSNVFIATSNAINQAGVKSNVVLPVFSSTTAGVHTIRIRNAIASSNGLTLFGCEVINENAAITQQPGADFDGNISLMTANSFPIKPINSATINARNDSSGTDAAFTGTTGARVLNYLTSGGQQKQVYEPAVETLATGSSVHTITFSTAGAGAVTLPADVTSWSILTFGSGGGGGGAAVSFTPVPITGAVASGGGGAGGGRSSSNFTKTGGGTTAIVTAVGAAGTGGGSAGLGVGTQTAGNGTAGGTTSVSVGGTELISATGGGFGTGGSGTAPSSFTVGVGATNEGFGQGSDGAKGSTNITAADTANSGQTNAGDDARHGGDGTGQTYSAGFTDNRGGGGGGAGAQPGGANGGGGGGISASIPQSGAAGGLGSIVLVFTSSSGTALTVTGGTDVVTTSGAETGAPFFNFGTTNHSRQEVIRRINFREFGANGDFAGTVTGSDAFTLDDGTTTLVGTTNSTNTFNGINVLSLASSSTSFLTLTFVGTGLDVFMATSTGTGVRGLTVSVDGLSIGSTTLVDVANFVGVVPIVSGLAYGTHTVRFSQSTTSETSGIADFIIYGPKKPEIPTLDAGSLELSDYNVMADADNFNDTASVTRISKGVLRKVQSREFLYKGTYASSSPSTNTSSINGIDIQLQTGSFDYTFYGTGFEWRMDTAGTNSVINFSADNSSDFSGSNFVIGGYGLTPAVGTAFAASTGTLTTTAIAQNSGFRITGFPLGVHTVTVTKTSGGDIFNYGFDVITPIHINDDTLKIGSEGLNNLTVDPVVEEDEQVVLANRGEAKAWLYFDPVNNVIESSYNISAVIHPSTGLSIVYFDKPFKDDSYSAVITTEKINTLIHLYASGILNRGSNLKLPNSVAVETRQIASSSTIANNSTGLSNNPYYAAFYGELIDE